MFSRVYNIVFHTNGGKEISSLAVKYKASFPELPVPEKDGYKFLGWYIDNECTSSVSYEKMIKGDVNLYAKWEGIGIEEFLNDIDFFTKASNILKNLQNDYSDVPDFKDPVVKKISKKTTSKKTTTKKSIKKTSVKKSTTKKPTVKKDSVKTLKVASKVENNNIIIKDEINDNTGN